MATTHIFKLTTVFTNADTGKNLSFGLHGHGLIGGDPDVGALEDDVVAWWETDLNGGSQQRSYHDADITLVRCALQRIDPFEAVVFENDDNLPSAGTLAGDQYTGQASVLVSLRTAKVGRSYRGRAYLPPPGEAAVAANGSIASADAVNIAQQFQGLLELLAVDSFVPVVYSTQHAKVPAVEWNDVTSIMVDRLLRTQRRRQDRRPVYESP